MEKYHVITADPPWQFKTYSVKGQVKGAERHYQTMDMKALKSLPVSNCAAKVSVLLLWATWPNLPLALELGAAWGFTYKTLGFIWIKRSSQGKAWHTGLGYYTRSNSEPCLLFTRGKPKRKNAGVHQLIEDDESVNTLPGFEEILSSRLTAHSAKPDEFYDRVTTLLKPTYLELFGRHLRKGWTVLGNEIDGQDIAASLRELT